VQNLLSIAGIVLVEAADRDHDDKPWASRARKVND
jgi:hypothetical protein